MYTTHKSKKHQQKRITNHAQKTDSYSFFNLLTNSKLLSVVDEQLPDHRERIYPPTVTLSLFLSQAMNSDASCQNAVNNHAVERTVNGLSPCSVKTGAYCKARQRLPIEMLATLVKQTGKLITEQANTHWKWKNRSVKLVDGTTITMPDTKENQQAYPQQHNQAPGVGFPIARIVAIICMASGAVLGGAMGAYKGKGGSEHTLFRQLLDCLNPGDVVLADRYYCSFFLIAMLVGKGVDVVFQQHAKRHTDFRKGKRLGSGDHIVRWEKPKTCPHWMSRKQYENFPDELIVRELKVGKMILATTLLSDKEFSKKELKIFYKQRWHVELDLRNIKTTLGMENLSCKVPEMNEKEMYVYFLAYNLIRLIMAEAAVQTGRIPRQLSFKHSLQVWLAWSKLACFVISDDKVMVLLTIIAAQQVGNRPGRIEPRSVKRRLKPYPSLTQCREKARAKVQKHGHPKKLK